MNTNVDLPAYTTEKATEPAPSYTAAVAIPGRDTHRILRPVAALQNGRYNREFTVNAQSFPIRTGQFNDTAASIAPWTEYTHPEGMPYFYHPGFRVITDSFIHDGPTMSALMAHLEDILDLMKQRDMVLVDFCDLFMQLDCDQDICNYYIANHSQRRLSWLEDISSEDLCLPYAVSPAQLQYALAEEYWAHIEFFPLRVQDLQGAAAELSRALTFGRGDQLTSDNSTFPYDAQQCANFLDLIRESRQEGQEFTWLIARVWTFVARHRFDTYYGQQCARINRDQRRLGPRAIRRPFVMKALSFVLFQAPDHLAAEMDLLHVDELVYTIHWRKFIKARMADWTQASMYAGATLLAHLIAAQQTGDSLSRAAGLAGAILAAGSLITTTGLLQRYSGAEALHATDAVEHVRAIDHPKLGFQLVASVFSLPRAFQMWSLIVLALQIILVAIAMDNIPAMIVVCVVGFVIGCILLATVAALTADYRQDTGGGTWWGRLLPGCHSLNSTPSNSSPV